MEQDATDCSGWRRGTLVQGVQRLRLAERALEEALVRFEVVAANIQLIEAVEAATAAIEAIRDVEEELGGDLLGLLDQEQLGPEVPQ